MASAGAMAATAAEETVDEALEVLEEALQESRRTSEDPEPILTLGIETSCDETAVAVLAGATEIRANVVTSSAALHERYGGVVPEIASRAQVQAINPALQEALQQAETTFWDLSTIAVTIGPGLVGSLMVGVSAAKALASVLDIPLVGVNHLEAHIYANLLEHPDAGPPAVALIVSGGHTLLVHMVDHGIYDVVGQTLDDAAGEAFDKVARFLDLGFPGGPPIDGMARKGNREAIEFPRALMDDGYDFSFSGLKTAVIRYLEKERSEDREVALEDVAASFQEAVAEVLTTKCLRAAAELEVPTVFLSGGVAANSRLRELLEEGCRRERLDLYSPRLEFCTDNAAMVAGCGYHRFRRGIRTPIDVAPDPNLPLA